MVCAPATTWVRLVLFLFLIQRHSTAEAGLTDSSFTMSVLTSDGRITYVGEFSSVAALENLPVIHQHPNSSPSISRSSVNLAEGCLLTKSVKYAHQLAHWVNAVRDGDPGDIVSTNLKLIGDTITECYCISFRSTPSNSNSE